MATFGYSPQWPIGGSGGQMGAGTRVGGLEEHNDNKLSRWASRLGRRNLQEIARFARGEQCYLQDIIDDPTSLSVTVRMLDPVSGQTKMFRLERSIHDQMYMGVDMACGVSNATTCVRNDVGMTLNTDNLQEAVKALMPKEKIKPPREKKYDKATRMVLLKERLRNKQNA